MSRTVASLAASGALILMASTASAQLRGQQLDVVERATSDTLSVHAGASAENVGDILTFVNEVFDSSNSRKLGHDHGYCVRLAVGKSMECHWTLILAEGQIMADGPVYDDRDSVMAVTGGTGNWADVRGEVTVHARDAQATSYDFHYRFR